MKAFIFEAYSEFFDRKIIYLFAVVTLMALFVILLADKVQMSFQLDSEVESLQFPSFKKEVLTRIIVYFMSAMVFLTVMATAGVMPNTLVRGRSEYYLSRPYSRFSFFLYKLLSCWTVYGTVLLTSGLVALLTLWLVHDLVAVGLVYSLLLNLLTFLIWLLITFSVGIISRSTTTSMMVAFIIYFAHWILNLRDWAASLINSQAVSYALDALYYILPKPREIADIILKVAGAKPVESWMPLWSSLVFVLILAVVTIQIFNRKDY